MADNPYDPAYQKKKKTPATAADQADAVENTAVGAANTGTAAGSAAAKAAAGGSSSAEAQQFRQRQEGQAAVDRDKFTLKTPETTSGHVIANYEGFGLGGAKRVQDMAKAGKSADEIVKALGLKKKQQK